MLKLDNVTKTFGTFKALDCLSLSVPKGAVYGLVGPNGAGKSTVIRHLTGIYQPDSGTVTIDGQPVADDPNLKERIGYISDDVFYFPAATMRICTGSTGMCIPGLTNPCIKSSRKCFPCPPAAFAGSPRECRSRQPSI